MSREMILIPKYKYDKLIQNFQTSSNSQNKEQNEHSEESHKQNDNSVKGNGNKEINDGSVKDNGSKEINKNDDKKSYISMKPSAFHKVKRDKIKDIKRSSKQKTNTMKKWLKFKI